MYTLLVPPEFVSSPSNFLKQDDESVQLSCTVYGYPLPDIQWQKDDQLIELTPSITTTITTNQSSLTVSSVLSIVNLNHTNGGLYSCYTFNDLVHVLSAISDQGDVIVNCMLISILIQLSSNHNLKIHILSNLSLTQSYFNPFPISLNHVSVQSYLHHLSLIHTSVLNHLLQFTHLSICPFLHPLNQSIQLWNSTIHSFIHIHLYSPCIYIN